jgi:hypothetical protein
MLSEAVVPPSDTDSVPVLEPLTLSVAESPIGLPTVSWPVTDVTDIAEAIPSLVNIKPADAETVMVVDAPVVTGAVHISDAHGVAVPVAAALARRVQVRLGELFSEQLIWLPLTLSQIASMQTTSSELLSDVNELVV